MTVNRRLAKSHGFYLQHAKEVCLVARKGHAPHLGMRSERAWPDVILRSGAGSAGGAMGGTHVGGQETAGDGRWVGQSTRRARCCLDSGTLCVAGTCLARGGLGVPRPVTAPSPPPKPAASAEARARNRRRCTSSSSAWSPTARFTGKGGGAVAPGGRAGPGICAAAGRLRLCLRAADHAPPARSAPHRSHALLRARTDATAHVSLPPPPLANAAAGRYLEIFGRKNNLRDYWVTIGNEITGKGLPASDASALRHGVMVPGAVYGRSNS